MFSKRLSVNALALSTDSLPLLRGTRSTIVVGPRVPTFVGVKEMQTDTFKAEGHVFKGTGKCVPGFLRRNRSRGL